MEIFLATGNQHKKSEFQSALANVQIKIPRDCGLQFNPIETGTTFLENALIKARSLYRLVKTPVLADDSGLCVQALHGAPGIYSARYAVDHAGTQAQDMTNIQKLLKNLQGVKNRNAYFVCCIVLYFGENRFTVVQETCEGIITEKCSGENGFGYDPIFFLPQLNRTMAALTESEKNAVSHRGKALKTMGRILQSVNEK